MSVNIAKGIDLLKQQIGRASYSMYGSRNFSDGTCDCSGAVYYALTNSGVKPFGYIPSTETMHSWLTSNGYSLIAENTEWEMQAQDVIIWGQKGQSAGAGGHTGIAVDGQNWIECTAWTGGGNGANGGVIIANHDSRWAMNDRPYFYVYRSQQDSNTDYNNTIQLGDDEEMKTIIITNDADYYGKKYTKGSAFVLTGTDLRYVERPQTLANLKVLGVPEFKFNQIDLLYIIQDLGLRII